MSEIVRVLGVDPSLRNTGVAIVNFNTETGKFKVTDCQVLQNPMKFTGNEAILNMLDMIQNISLEECYKTVDNVIVESPPVMFNKNYSSSTVSLLAHVSGGAIALLGLEKGYLFKPSEWNKARKKDLTHQKVQKELGNYHEWNYKVPLKNERTIEHILDAASMAHWWIKENFSEE